MKLGNPYDVYSELEASITGSAHRFPAVQAKNKLEVFFAAQTGKLKAGATPKPLVIFVDELDCLMTPNQTVLHDLFDWPVRHRGLAIIGVSNTIDLPA
mmetsp:Transcript_21384/g.62283  ORF Transcript_21384/g.62283 Transcript_21384/m.62283 type:complete len:98 (-) Transcript_21384:8-301(-)